MVKMFSTFGPPSVETFDPKRNSTHEVAAIGHMTEGSPYRVAMLVKGVQVGICVADRITDEWTRYSIPGWYITFIEVSPAYQNRGYGTAVFTETMKRLVADGHTTVYMVHGPTDMEVKTAFGFQPWPGWAAFPKPSPDSALYVASPVLLSS